MYEATHRTEQTEFEIFVCKTNAVATALKGAVSALRGKLRPPRIFINV